MPEPAPGPDGEKLLNSAIIEQDYDRLPGLCNIEKDDAMDDPANPPVEKEAPVESVASEPPTAPESPVLPPSDVTPCNQMQHDSQNGDDVAPPAAPRQGLRSCPVPPDVLKARNEHQKYLELLDTINSIEETPIPKIEKIEKEDSPADAEAKEEEILV
jgi:hypothetical protein